MSEDTKAKFKVIDAKLDGKLNKSEYKWQVGILIGLLSTVISFQTYMIMRVDDRQTDIGREVSEISGSLEGIELINLDIDESWI